MAYKRNKKEYSFISIQLSDLCFDERVADMVEEYGAEFPSSLLNNIFSANTFKLDPKRLVSVMDGYDTGLPPIAVKKVIGGKYQVLNGRHRVCATIIKNGDTVPVTLFAFGTFS